MTIFDASLDLRGRTVRLIGDRGRPAPVLTIPPDAKREHLRMCVQYGWGYRAGRVHAHHAHHAYQNTCPEAAAHTAASPHDIVEVLEDEVTAAPAPSYSFRARRYQDIDLARISREIGPAPYATAEWNDQSMVIAGDQALRRAEAVDYVPTLWHGWQGMGITPNGSVCLDATGCVAGWTGPDAQVHAAEWWAEVRRRERPDVTVTVTPAT